MILIFHPSLLLIFIIQKIAILVIEIGMCRMHNVYNTESIKTYA